MTNLGIPRLVVSKILTHAEQSVTEIYDRHSYYAEKKATLLKWDRALAKIISGKPTEKVIELPARA